MMLVDERPWEWHSLAGGLHALPLTGSRPCLGDETTALCGAHAELTRADFQRGRKVPTCEQCSQKWSAWQRAQTRQ